MPNPTFEITAWSASKQAKQTARRPPDHRLRIRFRTTGITDKRSTDLM